MSALAEFHWLRPEWLLALLPVGALFLLLWRRQVAAGDWQRVIDPALLLPLASGDSSPRHSWGLGLLGLGWLTAVVALAGPSWQRLPQPVFQQQDALIIALDLSPSMFAQDLEPSRLERAKREIRDALKLRQEGLTALIVYAGDAHVVVPLTDDSATIELLLPTLGPELMPVPGSDPLAALRLARTLAEAARAGRARVLLITDGIFTPDFPELASLTADGDLELSILGVGTRAGAPIALPEGGFLKNAAGDVIVARLDERALARWANASGQRYRTAHYSDADLEYLLAPDRAPRLQAEASESERRFDTWRDAGPSLALLLLPLALLAFRRGWLLSLVLGALLLPPQPGHALSWDDLWRTPDQQGRDALAEGEPERAAERFTDPNWQGVARYRAGDYTGAAEAFGAGGEADADAHYNRGNALARAGDLPGALEAYESALALNPADADAAANRAVVEELLRQQAPSEGAGDTQEQDSPPDGNDGSDGDQSGQQGDRDGQDSGGNQGGQEGQEGQGDEPGQGGQPSESGSGDPEPGGQPGDRQGEQPDSPPEDPTAGGTGAAPEGEADGPAGDSASEASTAAGEATPGDPPQEGDATAGAAASESTEDAEAEQALQQWLRQIPDDPGALLRRKFDYQYQRQRRSARGDATEERY